MVSKKQTVVGKLKELLNLVRTFLALGQRKGVATTSTFISDGKKPAGQASSPAAAGSDKADRASDKGPSGPRLGG